MFLSEHSGLKSPERIKDAFVPFRSLNVRAKFEHEKIKFAPFQTTFLGKLRLSRINEACDCYDFGPRPLVPLLTGAYGPLQLLAADAAAVYFH